MKHVYLLSLALLVGCDQTEGLEGKWGGVCTLEDEGWPEPIAVSLRVTADNGDAIEGTGTFTIPGGDENGIEASAWAADLEGSHVGEQVDLWINGEPEFEYEIEEIRLEVSATVHNDAIDGDCTLAGIGGTIKLRR
jgi:hypothetical protein